MQADGRGIRDDGASRRTLAPQGRDAQRRQRGHYRFALEDRESAALLARADSLPAREAMMLADSVSGGFDAGAVCCRGCSMPPLR